MNTLKLSEIIPDANQPRKYFAAEKMGALRESIKKHGVMTPIIVQKTTGGKYLLVDGERRFRAALELRLKEVPVVIMDSTDPITRLVEQFHIQEMHEGWSAMEKAQVLINLAKETGQSITQLSDTLGVAKRTAVRYLQFAKLATSTQNKMIDMQVNIEHAEAIEGLKRHVRNIKENIVDEPFSKANEVQLEKACIDSIKDKELEVKGDYSRLKDSFTMNPKLITKFLEGNQSISEMFVKSHAKSAYHLRNFMNNAGYVHQHGLQFIQNPDVKLNASQIGLLERCQSTIKKILEMAG